MSLLRTALLLAMLGLAGGIAAGFLGFVHPAFDTFSNFRLHFSVILLVLAALWSFRCSRAPSLVFALIGFGGLFACAPGLPLTSYANLPSGGERVYRAFVMNLWWRNEDPTQVAKEIAKHDPDILYLVEASRTWVSTITELQRTYPYIFQCPNWRNISGNVILSRMPMDDNQDQCDSKAALGLTKVIIDGKRVTAGIVHLRWPWPFSGSVQIDRIEPKLKSIGDNALIAGDFNASTWSYAIKRIARAGGIEVVSGIGPTWGPRIEFDDKPLLFLPTWIGLPIDNVFTKGAVRVVNARTLPWSGSDHRPILVDFVLQ